MNTSTKSPKRKFCLPKTTDGCSCTITASVSHCGVTNLISTAHFPKGGGTNHQRVMKFLKIRNNNSQGYSLVKWGAFSILLTSIAKHAEAEFRASMAPSAQPSPPSHGHN